MPILQSHDSGYHNVSRLVSSLLLWLLIVILPATTTTHACPLEIWTFNTFSECLQTSANVAENEPASRGAIQADNTCRPTEVLASAAALDPPGYQLPGIYQAQCSASNDGVSTLSLGSVSFVHSGCIAPLCPILDEDDGGGNLDPTTCTADTTAPGFLYAFLDRLYEVQNPLLMTEGFFQCFTMNGSVGAGPTVEVVYAIFGNCRCTDPPTMAPTSSTVTPTAAPITSPAATSPATPPSVVTPATTTVAADETTVGTTSATEQPNPGSTPATTTAASTPTTPAEEEFPDESGDDGDSSSSSNSTLPLIIGGAAGALVGMGLLALLVWFTVLRKDKTSKHARAADNDSITPREAPTPTSQSNPSSAVPNMAAEAAAYHAALFGEVLCESEKADDVSTLGEPIGLEGMTTDERFEELTVSTPLTSMNQMLNENRSVMENSTATDPDLLLPFADTQADDEESFEQVYRQRRQGHDPSKVLRFEINVPPGRLGMLLDTGSDGRPMVHTIKSDSLFTSHPVRVGDSLVMVDRTDVSTWTATKVSELIVSKARQPRRVFTFERISDDEHSEQEV